MAFMYVILYKTRDGISAKVSTDGSLQRSVGSENSQLTHGPFAVFQVHEFTGLENVDTEDLVATLRQRMTVEKLIDHFGYDISNDQLIDMLKRRMDD